MSPATARIAARRAGRLGDGYFPAIYPNSRVPELLPKLIDEMRVGRQRFRPRSHGRLR